MAKKGVIKKVMIGLATVTVLASAWFGFNKIKQMQNANNNEEDKIVEVVGHKEQQDQLGDNYSIVTEDELNQQQFEQFKTSLTKILATKTGSTNVEILAMSISDGKLSVTLTGDAFNKTFLINGSFDISCEINSFAEANQAVKSFEDMKFTHKAVNTNETKNVKLIIESNEQFKGYTIISCGESGFYNGDYGKIEKTIAYLLQNNQTGEISYHMDKIVTGITTNTEQIKFSQTNPGEDIYEHKVKTGNFELLDLSQENQIEFGENLFSIINNENTF